MKSQRKRRRGRRARNQVFRRMETSNKAKQVSSERRISYSLQGLPLVFQVWVWEVAQGIGEQYCDRVEGDRFPRGIRWYLNDSPEHGVVEASLGDKKTVVKPIILPESEDEERLLKDCEFEEENVHKHFDKIVDNAIAAKVKAKGRRDKVKKVSEKDWKLVVVDDREDDPVSEDDPEEAILSAPAKKVGKKVGKKAPKRKPTGKKATAKKAPKIDEAEDDDEQDVKGQDDDEEEQEDVDDDGDDGDDGGDGGDEDEDKGDGGANVVDSELQKKTVFTDDRTFVNEEKNVVNEDVVNDQVQDDGKSKVDSDEKEEDGTNHEVQNDAIMEDNVVVDLGVIVAEPVARIENVEQVYLVNDVIKDISPSQGADENQGEGADSERTETDDVGDGPTEDITQVTQEGVVESKEDASLAVEEAANVGEKKGADEVEKALELKAVEEEDAKNDEKEEAVHDVQQVVAKPPVEKRKNPPRNAKKADENTKNKLKKITKNTSCKEMTDFLTWYSDERFVLGGRMI